MSSPAPDDVGRALSALADADADTGDRPESRPPAAVVAEARDAFQSLSADAGAAEAPNRSSRAAEGRPRDADHFRSGRTTVFSGGGEPSDR